MSRPAHALLLIGAAIIGLASELSWRGELWPTIATILVACYFWTRLVLRLDR